MARTMAKLTSALLATTALGGFAGAYAQDADAAEEARETIVVRGVFIPDEKRETSEISSIVDAADFSAAGDGDAAAALTRVTGLTIANNKFVFVRGLNERYSSATLNRSPLPSPEPLRRVAPLDLFPTSVLDSVFVQKTFAPEFSGEFGGGLIDLRTKAVPTERFFEVSGTIGVNTETSFQDGLLYDGGEEDWTGFDDGTRNVPPELGAVFGSTRVQTLGEDQLEGIGEALVGNASELLVVQEGSVSPDGGFSLAGGDRFDVNDALSFGVIGLASWDSSWATREGVRRETNIGAEGLEIRDDLQRTSTENDIRLTGLASVGVDILDDHEIKFTGLYTRSTTKEVRSFEGFDQSEGVEIREDSNEWFERQVWSAQLTGEHYIAPLNDLFIGWRASTAEAFRDAPYETQIRYELEGDQFVYRGNQAANRFRFSRIDDTSDDIGVDLNLPLDVGGFEIELKAGWATLEKERDASIREFRFRGSVPDPDPSTSVNEFLAQRIDLVLSPAGIGPGLFSLTEVGGQSFPEAYRGTLEVDAFYGGFEVQLTPFLRAAIGARSEDGTQTVDTFNTTLPDPGTIETAIEEDYVLPAASITWNPIEDVQVRFSYSQTITRPEFRELAFAEFINSETDTRFFGNPFLENTEIENFDARAEYYFARDQFFTLGGFYKILDKPIEDVLIPLGDSRSGSFINAPEATLYGVELEFERIFAGDQFGIGFLETKDLIFKTNYTWSESEVDAEGTVILAQGGFGSQVAQEFDGTSFIVDGRQLQGQSENIFNLSVGYEDFEAGSRAAVLFNFASERILAADNLASNLPAIIEEPPMRIDFVYSRIFDVRGNEIEFGFKAQNINNDDYVAFQEQGGTSIDVDTYNLGTSISASVTTRF